MNTIVSVALALLFITASPASALSLKECLARAAVANQQLKASAYDEKIAAGTVRITESAYLPRVDFQAGYVAQLEPQAVKIAAEPIATQQAEYGYVSLSLYQTLYDFGRTSRRVEQAVHTRDALLLTYGSQEQDIFFQVIRTYYGILTGEKYLATADDEVRQMENHLKVAKNLYEQGVVTRNDLLQAEVRLANSRQKRLSVANNIENGWLYLNLLTGENANHRAVLEQPEQQTETADLDMMMEIARRKRHEIGALKKAIKADEAAINEYRTHYYPEIFAKLGLDYVENDRVQEQTIMAATIGLKMNLFEGFATASRQQQALHTKTREEEKLRNLEANIRLELETAMNDLRVAEKRIAVSELAIRQSEENLRINSDRYLEKVGTATEVLDAQTLLTQTRTDYFRSIFDYQIAAARVKRAVGEL